MDPAIRRCVWLLQVGMLTAAALFTARTLNLFVEASIAPPAPAWARSSGPPAKGLAPSLDVAGLARITGLPTKTVSESDDVPATLRVRLLGTLLSADPAWSIASLLDLTRQRSSTVMVGDRVQDCRVLEILRDRVIVAHNGRREVIGLDPREGTFGPSGDALTRARTDPPLSGQGRQSGIRALDDNHYEVPRSELEAALNHFDEISTDVRVLPAYKDGEPRGFKLFAIRKGSIFSRIGMLDGDVVRRVNGFEMNTPENALEAYVRLRDANRIDIELERDGSSIRKSYSVR
jgi:general secretion pathway protein C